MQALLLCSILALLVRPSKSLVRPLPQKITAPRQRLIGSGTTTGDVKNAFQSGSRGAAKGKSMSSLNAASLSQYAPAAVSLFNNMKTPASILAGAAVPLGLLAPLPGPKGDDSGKEGKVSSFLRKIYIVVAICSLSSELISVMWATVAVNQLTETVVAPASSVWHLLKRDYELEWAATNAHFVLGMFGFMWMLGTRSLLMANADGAGLGSATACISASGLLLMVSIVNRGVQSGGGDGLRYGSTVVSLVKSYVSLLAKRAIKIESFGPLELGSIALLVSAIFLGVKALLGDQGKKKEV